jgi:hypothetical protein
VFVQRPVAMQRDDAAIQYSSAANAGVLQNKGGVEFGVTLHLPYLKWCDVALEMSGDER